MYRDARACVSLSTRCRGDGCKDVVYLADLTIFGADKKNIHRIIIAVV